MCSAFTMTSKQKESGKRKRVDLSNGEDLELIKKLESVRSSGYLMSMW